MKTCAVSLESLSAFVDGELAPADELDLRRHLDGCVPCRTAVEALLGLKQAVAASAETRPVPHTLRERLAEVGAPARRGWLPRRGAVLMLGGAVAAIALAWMLLLRSSENDHVSQALVADHVHYLEVPDAVQAPLAERERLEAWFGERVDFPVSLPVLPGSRLLGGRLCSLLGQEMALAFYESGGRRVSLFVADAARFPRPDLTRARCEAPLGDYRVCLVPGPSNVLAAVVHEDQAANLLPQLEKIGSARH